MSVTQPSSSLTDLDSESDDIISIDVNDDNQLSSFTEMTCTKIILMLKNEKSNLKIINRSKKHTSNCWTRFGFPAAVDANGKIVKKFNDFVSCKSCFMTYSFKSNSTSLMNKHNCEDSGSTFSSTTQRNKPRSMKQSKIIPYSSKTPRSIKLEEYERNRIKKLLAEWVCTDIRPFSVINDDGLRSLIQECILLGIFLFDVLGLIFFFGIKGSKYGNISVDSVLCSAHNTSLHITKLADEYRSKIRQELIEPLENQSVTICPDLWTDPYLQISYLGISVCYTDEKYQFLSYDLCCSQYTEIDKTASNIIIVSYSIFKHSKSPFLFLGYQKGPRTIWNYGFNKGKLCFRSWSKFRESTQNVFNNQLCCSSNQQRRESRFLSNKQKET